VRIRMLSRIRRPKGAVSILVLSACLLPIALSGQMTARGLGMGGAYMALARGIHAADWNPANLGLPDNPGMSVSIVSVGVNADNNSFTQDLYNRYATDEYWDSNEIEDLLNHIPDDGLNANVLASVRALSFSAGRFAMLLGVDAGVDVRLDKTFLELPLQGNAINKTYSFRNTRAKGLAVAVVGLSYAQPVSFSFAKSSAIGATFHYNGGGTAHSEKTDLSFSTMDYGIDLDGEYEGKVGLSTSGWGLDLGAVSQLDKNWTFGVCLANLASSMRWDKEVKDYRGYVRGDSLDAVDFSEDDKDKNEKEAIEDSSWTVDEKSFTTRLPVVLRIGGAYRDGATILTFDYLQGFEENAWTSSKPRISVGTEWRKVRWLPLRMGVALGGKIGFGTSFGFGLHPGGIFLDIAVMNHGFIFPKSSKGAAVAVEIGIGP
jgi:hypothetical protein